MYVKKDEWGNFVRRNFYANQNCINDLVEDFQGLVLFYGD